MEKSSEQEWSKLIEQQEEFDFYFEDRGTWHLCWIYPGASWEFDPYEDEHHCEDIEDAIEMANCYIEEFPNRKTGDWSYNKQKVSLTNLFD